MAHPPSLVGEPPPYDHRQRAWWLRLLLAGLGVALLVVLVLIRGGTTGWLVGSGGVVLLVVAGWVFGSLRVVVSREHLTVAFGPGWPRRRLAIADVTDVERVRNRWWWGWGIRITPTGWMWNLSGLDAVLVTQRSGKRLRIGTDDPAGLSVAVRLAAGLGPPPRV